MATTLDAQFVAESSWRYHDEIGPRFIEDANSIGLQLVFDSDGVASLADEKFSRRVLVPEGSPVTLNFSGVENNVFGESLTMQAIKAVMIVNRSEGRLNELMVGGSSRSLGFLASPLDAVLIGPAGFLSIGSPDAAGWPVTVGVSDELRLTSLGGDLLVDVAVIGVYGGGGVIPETVFGNELGEMLANELGEELEVGV